MKALLGECRERHGMKAMADLHVEHEHPELCCKQRKVVCLVELAFGAELDVVALVSCESKTAKPSNGLSTSHALNWPLGSSSSIQSMALGGTARRKYTAIKVTSSLDSPSSAANEYKMKAARLC